MLELDSFKVCFSPLTKAWQSTYEYRGLLISYLLVTQIFLASTVSTGYVLGNGRSYVFSVEVSFIVCFLALYARPLQLVALIKQYRLSYLLLALFLLSFLFSSTHLFPEELPPLNSLSSERLRRINELLAHLGFGICVHQLLKTRPINTGSSPYFWAMFVSCLCVLGYVFYQWQIQGCSANPCKRWGFDPPVFQNIRHFGEFLVLTAVASSCCLFTGAKVPKHQSILLIIISSLAISSISWSGSRGSFLAILMPLSLFFIYMRRSRKLNLRLFYLWLFVTIACICILEQTANTNFLGIFSRLFAVKQDTTFNVFSSGRLYIWEVSLELVKQSPFFGFGGDAYLLHPKIPAAISHLEHPHNSVVQLLLETGVIGLLLVLALAVNLTISFWRNRYRKSRQEYLALLAFFALALSSLTGATFFAGITQMYAAICIAIFITNSSTSSPTSNQ